MNKTPKGSTPKYFYVLSAQTSEVFQLKFMSCIYFADDQTGWIGGTGISKTTNGGALWTTLNTGIPFSFVSAFMFSLG